MSYNLKDNNCHSNDLFMDIDTLCKKLIAIKDQQKDGFYLGAQQGKSDLINSLRQEVPNFIADMIERLKPLYNNLSTDKDKAEFLFNRVSSLAYYGNSDFYIVKWIIENKHKFILSILFGYTVKHGDYDEK